MSHTAFRQSLACVSLLFQDSKLKFFFLRTLGVVVSCVPVQLEREFEELDVDHDGFITAEDLVAASRSAPSNSNNAGE
jgi:hypothetical protein